MHKMFLYTLLSLCSLRTLAMQPQALKPQTGKYNEQATNDLKTVLNKWDCSENKLSIDFQNQIKSLIVHGANPNTMGVSGFGDKKTALHIAAYTNSNQLITFLLSHNADPNSNHGRCTSPLQLCAKNGNYYCVRLLIKHGANIHHADVFGYTPLLYATDNNHINIVRLLLQNGAARDIDKPGKDRTPLIVAHTKGFRDIERLLQSYKIQKLP